MNIWGYDLFFDCSDSHAREEDDEDGDDCDRDDSAGGWGVLCLPVVSHEIAGGEEIDGPKGFGDAGEERRHWNF